MQPQAPQRPVMDVKVPPRPATPMPPKPEPGPSQPMAVHEPPKDDGVDPGGPQPSIKDTVQRIPAEKSTAPKAQSAPKAVHPSAPLPVGAIVFAIFAMIALSALAILLYMQSQ